MPYGADAGEMGNGAEGMRLARPRALLLTDAAPQRDGTPARQRAWKLLELARETHEVHLLVRPDGAVHYDHWRDLSRLTRQITLAPRSWLRRDLRGLTTVIDAWVVRHPFDAVLCGEDSLWPAFDGVSARVRFCGSRHDLGTLAEVLAPPMTRDEPRRTGVAARLAA